jgi:hypothetical protein
MVAFVYEVLSSACTHVPISLEHVWLDPLVVTGLAALLLFVLRGVPVVYYLYLLQIKRRKAWKSKRLELRKIALADMDGNSDETKEEAARIAEEIEKNRKVAEPEDELDPQVRMRRIITNFRGHELKTKAGNLVLLEAPPRNALNAYLSAMDTFFVVLHTILALWALVDFFLNTASVEGDTFPCKLSLMTAFPFYKPISISIWTASFGLSGYARWAITKALPPKQQIGFSVARQPADSNVVTFLPLVILSLMLILWVACSIPFVVLLMSYLPLCFFYLVFIPALLVSLPAALLKQAREKIEVALVGEEEEGQKKKSLPPCELELDEDADAQLSMLVYSVTTFSALVTATWFHAFFAGNDNDFGKSGDFFFRLFVKAFSANANETFRWPTALPPPGQVLLGMSMGVLFIQRAMRTWPWCYSMYLRHMTSTLKFTPGNEDGVGRLGGLGVKAAQVVYRIVYGSPDSRIYSEEWWKNYTRTKNLDFKKGGFDCVTDRKVVKFLRDNESLKTLELQLCTRLSSISVHGIFKFGHNLVKVDISECGLSCKIPDMSIARSLEEFVCNDNQLYGHLPKTIKACTKLRVFHCQRNYLDGKIPSCFGDAKPLLEEIDCSGNNFSGRIPDLSACTKLQALRCSDCKLSGSIPGLDLLAHIVYFDVSRNQLSGIIPPGVGSRQTLRLFQCQQQVGDQLQVSIEEERGYKEALPLCTFGFPIRLGQVTKLAATQQQALSSSTLHVL